MAEIEGLPEVLAQLDELDRKVATKVLRTATTKTARVLVKDVKRRVKSKRIKKALKSKVRSGNRFATGDVGAKKGDKGAQLFHLWEFGTVGRVQRTTGRRTGYMPARPALRPAVRLIAPIYRQNLVQEFRAQTGAD